VEKLKNLNNKKVKVKNVKSPNEGKSTARVRWWREGLKSKTKNVKSKN
jgi:hypothetical protein